MDIGYDFTYCIFSVVVNVKILVVMTNRHLKSLKIEPGGKADRSQYSRINRRAMGSQKHILQNTVNKLAPNMSLKIESYPVLTISVLKSFVLPFYRCNLLGNRTDTSEITQLESMTVTSN